MKFVFAFLTLCVPCLGFAQNDTYKDLIAKAEELYQWQDYLQSARTYMRAFRANDDQGALSDRYNAACSWTLAGVPDSAFAQLFRIANAGNYSNVEHLTSDSDLNALHPSEDWRVLVSVVKMNKHEKEKGYNKKLVAELDSIYDSDQGYRLQLRDVSSQYGPDSEEMRNLWAMINKADSINLGKVTRIIDAHGWLGPDTLGEKGSTTLFLVIQHSDLATQEKYLPVMREAVKNGNAKAAQLALLEDRVALRKGEKQIYGSQIGTDPETGENYVMPLRDPENVDVRRAEVGLGPLSAYTSRFGFEWNPKEYVKKLPYYESLQNER